MTLSAAQQNAISPLAQRFLARLRAVLPGVASESLTMDGLCVRIEAACASVGALEATVEDEVTVFLGEHAHAQIAPWLFGDARDPEAILEAAEAAVEFIGDVLADRVVIWSARRDGHHLAGGSYGVGRDDVLARSATEAWLWSGRPVPIRDRGSRGEP